jgi:hypothetical protein
MNPKHEYGFAAMRAVSFCAALALSGLLLLPGSGMAQIVNLNDGGSSATLNLGSSAGMNQWSVNNQNQLNQQWFWYSTDSSKPAQPINTIGTPTVNTFGTTSTVSATYQNSQLSVNILYVLTGGGVGSGNADMTESISVVNLSPTVPLSLNFYQYSSFNLLQSGNNSVQIYPNQAGPGYASVQQTSGATAIQEAIDSPAANAAEAATGNTTLNELNGTAGLNLNDNLTAGPGNVTWAFQWTASVGGGQEFDILKDKSLSVQMIPEPSTVALAALGLGAWGLARRRRSS